MSSFRLELGTEILRFRSGIPGGPPGTKIIQLPREMTSDEWHDSLRPSVHREFYVVVIKLACVAVDLVRQRELLDHQHAHISRSECPFHSPPLREQPWQHGQWSHDGAYHCAALPRTKPLLRVLPVQSSGLSWRRLCAKPHKRQLDKLNSIGMDIALSNGYL